MVSPWCTLGLFHGPSLWVWAPWSWFSLCFQGLPENITVCSMIQMFGFHSPLSVCLFVCLFPCQNCGAQTVCVTLSMEIHELILIRSQSPHPTGSLSLSAWPAIHCPPFRINIWHFATLALYNFALLAHCNFGSLQLWHITTLQL